MTEEQKIHKFVEELVEGIGKYESPYSRNPLDDLLAEDDDEE